MITLLTQEFQLDLVTSPEPLPGTITAFVTLVILIYKISHF